MQSQNTHTEILKNINGLKQAGSGQQNTAQGHNRKGNENLSLFFWKNQQGQI